MAYIINNHGTLIDPSDYFGKDAEKLLKACTQAMRDYMYPYEGCNIAAGKPTLSDTRRTLNFNNTSSVAEQYSIMLTERYDAHPLERQMVEAFRKEWEAKRDKTLKAIYGIAKRHHLYLKWLANGDGPCMPDRWMIYRNGMYIGMIQC